jgi:pyridoxine 5-phosphate synthase
MSGLKNKTLKNNADRDQQLKLFGLERKSKIRLGVNVDHVATLRQARGGTTPYPNLLQMVKESIAGGGSQITIHLREDRRHIQLHDLIELVKSCPVPLNLEMAATESMFRIAKKYKPDWICLVPEKRAELTTEGGLNVVKLDTRSRNSITKLREIGMEVSMFIGPDLKQVRASHEAGADAVEFHTGHWVHYKGKKQEAEWKKLCEAAELAHELGMNVHAGHGLDYPHVEKIVTLPHLEELNIGHSLVCHALEIGMRGSVAKMVALIDQYSGERK